MLGSMKAFQRSLGSGRALAFFSHLYVFGKRYTHQKWCWEGCSGLLLLWSALAGMRVY